MDHEIDFGDVEIVKSPKTVQSVLDKRAMRDIWSAVRANDFDSVRRLLHALVPWLLEHADDDKACALAPMLSRMERQALAMVDNRTLLHELVVGVNGAKR